MAKYNVTAPSGRKVVLEGPEGATDEDLIEAYYELFPSEAPEGESPASPESEEVAPPGLIPAQPRKAGGPGYKPEAYVTIGGGGNKIIEYTEEERQIIDTLAAGDEQKRKFLMLIPSIEHRSNGDLMRSGARSPKGAVGPYQFIAETAKAFGVKDRRDFSQSAEGAALYYDELNARYKGNFAAMLADYNGGSKSGRAVMAGQPAPFEETREYLRLGDEYLQSMEDQGKKYAIMTGGSVDEQLEQTAREAGIEAAETERVARQEIARRRMEDPREYVVPLAEGALMMGTGAAGMLVGGLAALPFALYSNEAANTVLANVQDFFTYKPVNEKSKAALAKIAPYMEDFDMWVKDTSMSLTGGNPYLATALETGLNGALILLSGGEGAAIRAGTEALATGATRSAALKAAVKTGAKESTGASLYTSAREAYTTSKTIATVANDLVRKADELGVKLDRREIHDSLQVVAEGMSSRTRGQGLDEAARKLLAKKLEAKGKADAAWTDFRSQGGTVNVKFADNLAAHMAQELANEGFDLENGVIQGVLGDLAGLRTRVTTQINKKAAAEGKYEPRVAPAGVKIKEQTIQELAAVRSRIRKAAADAYGTEAGVAAKKVLKRLDETLDDQFRADAKLGMNAPAEAWMKARGLWQEYKDNWNNNKAIARILKDPDATPEMIGREILGTSAMLGSKQASKIYDDIMRLTDNDEGVKIAIRGSVMLDLLNPLTGDNLAPGQFRRVADNINKFTRENDSLIKAMGLDRTDLRAIQHAARVASHTAMPTPAQMKSLMGQLSEIVVRFTVGHEIAKAGMRVKLSQRFADWLLQKNNRSHRELLKEFAGISDQNITPMIPAARLAEALLKGEMVTQYQNLAEKTDEY